MIERLSDVEARIGSVRQLSAVVTAMRGIAATRSREARNRLDGIRAYADAIAAAIGQALTLVPELPAATLSNRAESGHAIIALCAEQGFAGTFNERVLDTAQAIVAAGPHRSKRLLLVGDRGLMVAGERSLKIEWSAPMITHVDHAADLAGRIVEALYDRIEAQDISEVTIVYTAPGAAADLEIIRKRLVPFDYRRFRLALPAEPPLITLPPQRLAESLAEEYVFAELCEAVILSFAAENEARTRAMIAAKTNVAKTIDSLTALSRQLRQEQITSELIELSSGIGEA
ncbi:F0F1 ATP synthase subunit gamma [Rhizobium binxianense]